MKIIKYNKIEFTDMFLALNCLLFFMISIIKFYKDQLIIF